MEKSLNCVFEFFGNPVIIVYHESCNAYYYYECRILLFIYLMSSFVSAYEILIFIALASGKGSEQSVTFLATDASLTADPAVMSSIPALRSP